MSENITNENAAGNLPPLPENPKFPEGLRVLVVDDDPTSLKIVSAMLEKCKYHVTPMTNATEALALLRKNKDNYDVVMTDVKMPDMDGFELLRIIGLEMDIPVIMMSVEDSTENVMKGVRHGARDYLVKPIRILELKNIWQHVMRKTVLNPEKSSLMTDEIVMGDLPLKKRRGKDKEKEGVNAVSDNASTVKKRRFAWTQELHKKFVEAVQQLDADKAVPKQIVEIMNEPQITREIVASHLQKYRNYLKKEQEKMKEERDFNAGQKGIPEAYLNPTPTSYSDSKLLHMLREASNGGSNGSGMLPFNEHLPKPEALNDSALNEDFVSGSLNQQSLWSQHNYNSPQMSNQALAPKPISALGNTPLAQSWVANPSAKVMFGDYADMSPQNPNIGAVQSGPSLGFVNFAGQSGHSAFPATKLPLTEHASHPGPPDVFAIVGNPYRMLDGASSHSLQRNALPGQNDGRAISTAFNGGVASDRGGYPDDFQAMEKSREYGQGPFMKLLTDTMDEGLSTQGKQSGPASAPME